MSIGALLLVSAGGFVAAIIRFYCTHGDTGFPWRTLCINILGSLLLGLVLAGLNPQGIWYDLLVIGFCGTLTTFSSFAWQTVALAEHHQLPRAVAYLILTTVLSVLGGGVGIYLGTQLRG